MARHAGDDDDCSSTTCFALMVASFDDSSPPCEASVLVRQFVFGGGYALYS